LADYHGDGGIWDLKVLAKNDLAAPSGIGEERDIFNPKVSIIIPTRDGYRFLEQVLTGLLNKTSYSNFHIVIVDNDSSDRATLDYLEDMSRKDNISVLRYPHEFNFSAINNFAVDYIEREIGSDLLLLLNDDIEVVREDWLSEMVRWFSRDDVGAVGAKLYYPDGRIQHAGVVIGMGGVAGHSFKYLPGDVSGPGKSLETTRQVTAVTAACLLTSLRAYKEVGGLDENQLKVAFNDVDYCLKVRDLGLKIVWTPKAECIHHESVSRGDDLTGEKKVRFHGEIRVMKERWDINNYSDPFYNKNLSLESHFYRLSRK
jgi:GT2 family glycosyltransferase